MKSIHFKRAFLVLLISGGLAACANDAKTDAAKAGASADSSIAAGAPPADLPADIDTTTDPSMTPTTPAMTNSDGTPMDGTAMSGATAEGSVMGNAASATSTTRCEGLLGQALSDCTSAQEAEARTSDSVPLPPAQ